MNKKDVEKAFIEFLLNRFIPAGAKEGITERVIELIHVDATANGWFQEHKAVIEGEKPVPIIDFALKNCKTTEEAKQLFEQGLNNTFEKNPKLEQEIEAQIKKTVSNSQRRFVDYLLKNEHGELHLGKVTGTVLGAVAISGGLAYLWNRHREKQPHQNTPWTERITTSEPSIPRNL